MADLSHEQLVELVVGKAEKPRAVFYEKAALDVAASKKAGHRVYKPVVYIRLIQNGVKDNISYAAQDSDKREYAAEYQEFLRTKQGVSDEVSIEIIPNLSITHKQELIDIGFPSINKLAEAEAVPPHLEYARKSAIMLNAILQEQKNAQKENHEESRAETKDGYEAHRQKYHDDVGRREVPGGDRRAGNDPGRVRESGRTHRSQGINGYDWSFEIKL